ncbi:hypothetical protein J6TS1_40610 [Siminovitchia terrae]|uniref:Uncharacterized protein n=1 Tax=Siminovitchia terrae TaxID=1914933 RepID=A0A429X3Q0_SIMTE|nr:hypothetical protein [Siminovitchia terrae]RST58006.1 hypothetical protein D5F11_019660 [Siminovitchia terrae]GIN92185.1 hypothetical protein J22TS1_32360 [Siminovitchia terrae]GIN98191.1 hypothetical protein J6TS1_40610 [Siminovitchia terrae]
MDKLPKRVLYNPNGSFVMKQWDDSVIVKRKQESAIGLKNVVGMNSIQSSPNDIPLMDEPEVYEDHYLEESGSNWVTELDYY